ncbi:MAG: hypothetical protein ACYC0V_11830, partial [Armatimonadota bacterium]
MISSIVSCLAIGCSADNAVSQYPLGKDGSIRYWMLLLPIPNPASTNNRQGSLEALDSDFLKSVGGERNYVPSTGVESFPNVKWFPRGSNGHVNL